MLLTIAPADLVNLLLLDIADVGHVVIVVRLLALWQEALRGIFSDDHVFLHSAVT